MSVEYSIQLVRNKALHDISEAVYGKADYCWQEESADESRVSKISSILSSLEADEKRIKEKYQKRVPEQKKETQDERTFSVLVERNNDNIISRFHRGDVEVILHQGDAITSFSLSVKDVERIVASLCHFLFSVPVSHINEIVASLTKRYF